MENTKYQTLVLNKNWFPVEIIGHEDVFRLLAKGHAKALETKCDTGDADVTGTFMMYTLESWIDIHSKTEYSTLNTVSLSYPVPEIIVLQKYDDVPRKQIKFGKENLLIRDGFECAYCPTTLTLDTTTIDHIIPQSKGGPTTWENCISSCTQCNGDKADHNPIGKYKPKKKAKVPTFGPLYSLNKKLRKMNHPKSWDRFLFR